VLVGTGSCMSGAAIAMLRRYDVADRRIAAITTLIA
jgi:hypothetical protein